MQLAKIKPRVAALVGVIAFLALLACMPLSFALNMAVPQNGTVTAKAVSGPIWRGVIADLDVGAASLGRVEASLRPLPLFAGRAEYRFEAIDPGKPATLSGIAATGIGGFGLKQVTGNIPLRNVDARLPLSHFELRDFAVRFDGERCRDAHGSVRLMLQPGLFSGLGLDNGFLGQARCDGTALVLPLLSQSALEKADIRIEASGKYTATITVQNDVPELGIILSAAGFAPISGGYRMTVKGQF